MASKKKKTSKKTAKKAAKKTAKKKTTSSASKKPVAKKPIANKKKVAKKSKARSATKKTTTLADKTRLPEMKHHAVSPRDMRKIAHEGLRAEGEILHVEENEFSPCRLVDHGEGRFSLCFDDFRMPQVPLFEERGLQGGGYTWEVVVQSLVKMKRPELEPQISYDSESGMFVALGSRDALRGVAQLIQAAIKDAHVLRAAVDAADPDRLE